MSYQKLSAERTLKCIDILDIQQSQNEKEKNKWEKKLKDLHKREQKLIVGMNNFAANEIKQLQETNRLANLKKQFSAKEKNLNMREIELVKREIELLDKEKTLIKRNETLLIREQRFDEEDEEFNDAEEYDDADDEYDDADDDDDAGDADDTL
jgi:hypothetical protein